MKRVFLTIIMFSLFALIFTISGYNIKNNNFVINIQIVYINIIMNCIYKNLVKTITSCENIKNGHIQNRMLEL